jgi:pimeloyl-CoA synthetase
LNSIIKAMQQEELNAIPEIRRLLGEIENMSSLAFAEECADRLTHEKHNYHVTGYIAQLHKVITLLEAGAEPEEAIVIVDSCIDIGEYIEEQLGKEKRNV